MNETKQETINRVAWSACDIFRKVMEPTIYKDYILTMLFLKYISDIKKDLKEKYREQYDGNEERVQRRLSKERFILDEGASFDDLYHQRLASNIGEEINKALESIESTNKAKLEGVFRNIDFNSEANFGQTKDRNRMLKELLELFNREELNMRPSYIEGDVIGRTYIYLIDKFASDAGKKGGEFYTPFKVSELVARLCRPKSGARICDPACGSGSLLLEAGKQIEGNNYSLYGMESQGSTWALGRLNMFLHEADSTDIKWCDTLTNPLLLEEDQLIQFDNVVANPPFSLKSWGFEEAENDRFRRFWRGIPPKTKGDYAFISHMIEVAKPRTGRVSVVVPHGVLFRGSSEGKIRQKLIEENLLDAVIGLPANLFQSTSIPVAILVFDKAREKGGSRENDKDVLFIDASKEFQSGKNQNKLLDDHVEKIMEVYESRVSQSKYSHVGNFEEIEQNEFNLNIPRYVDTFEEEEPIDIDAVQQEIQVLENDLVQIQSEMKTVLDRLDRGEEK